MLDLLTAQVSDEYARENFKKIQDAWVRNPVSQGIWKVLEIAFYKAETNLKVAHTLNFLPKDVILTSKTGAGSLTINYDKTDLTNLDLTTSAACVVRLLIGSLN